MQGFVKFATCTHVSAIKISNFDNFLIIYCEAFGARLDDVFHNGTEPDCLAYEAVSCHKSALAEGLLSILIMVVDPNV